MSSTRPLPGHEEERLAELHRFAILDTPPETVFDRLADLAAELLHAPIALITLVDRERVWIKSSHGLKVGHLDRKRSLCAQAILHTDIYEVTDTLEHRRSRRHDLVAGAPHVRFYAAAPLRSSREFNVGAVCVMDTKPRKLTPQERDALTRIAQLAAREIERRQTSGPGEPPGQAAAPAEAGGSPAPGSADQGMDLFTGGPTVIFKWRNAEDWPVEYVSSNVRQFGYEPGDFTSGKILYARIVHPDDLARIGEEVQQHSASGVACFDQEYRILTGDGQVRWVYDFTNVVRDAEQRIAHYHGYVLDITAQKRDAAALKESFAQYEAMVEAFDGLVYIASPDFKVEFMNKRLIERTGRNAVGEDCYRALHNREDICPWCVSENVFKGKTVRWEVKSPKDNRWYYVVNTPIPHEDGTVSKMAMIQDITERKDAEDTMRRKDAILESVAYASEQFLKGASWEKHIREVLERLGHATGVGRVYVFQNHRRDDGVLLTSQRFEWVVQGVAPQIYNRNLQNFALQDMGFGRWEDTLRQGRVIDGNVREFPDRERAVLEPQGILSILIVPVFVDQTWWGFLGFDECTAERRWSPIEVDALKAAASLLGAAIRRQATEEALRKSEEQNRVVLNAIPDLMFRLQRDGTFLDFRAEKESELAVPPSQILGRKVHDLLPKDVADTTMAHIGEALATGQKQVYEYSLQVSEALQWFECRMVVSGRDEVLAMVRNITERKNTESELSKLSSAVTQSGDSIVITDAQGVIEYVNPAFEQLTGYSSADVLGKTPAVLKSGRHDANFYKKLWQKLQSGSDVRVEFINRRKNGELYYQSETITPIKDAQGRVSHFVSVGRDISERVAAEEALRESQRRLAEIINFLPDATFAVDREGRVIAWNKAIETLTGVRAEEMLGKGDMEYSIPFYGKRRPTLIDLVLHPDPAFEKQYDYIERVGENLMAEVTLAPRDKPVHVWATAAPLYDVHGNINGVIESIRDITERKEAEQAIRKLAAFPQLDPNAVLEFTADGTPSYFNKAAKDMAGALGRASPIDILPANTTRIITDCLKTGETRRGVEVTVGRRTLSWSFFPIMDSQTVHAHGVDITDRLNLENQMRHLQKMEAVGRLAGGVAHDFNNVLTAIMGYTSMLLLDASLPKDVCDQLREIARAADSASNLTRQLLTFSRKRTLQTKPLHLNDVLKDLSSMLTRLIGEDISFEVRYGERLPIVRADQSMIEQLLVNLVINARDAMPGGGRIVISTSYIQVTEEQTRDNPEARAGNFVCLTVADTGCGIRKDHQAHIFEPFFTTKETGRGSGLGLATVYGVVKQHGGWVEVASEENQGAVFNIFFPAHAGAAKPKETKKEAPPVRGGTETILVVEDEPTVLQLACSVLKQFGYDVLEASSGSEGLSAWKKQEGKIDLLLADVVMPGGLTGTELADRLLKKKPGLKVILTSGYHMDSIVQKSPLSKGVHFLPKPFSPEELARAVRSCLDG